jgi:RHS repeat-associated protein
MKPFTHNTSTLTDYYAFGSEMPGRNYSSNSYRYGFNGQEKVEEINGVAGNHNTAMFWEYDTRLGRRWNIDPVPFAWQSPYAAFNNNPIYYADPTGATGEETTKKGDTFVGDDGKTYTSSYDAVEIVGNKQISVATGANAVGPAYDTEAHFPSNMPSSAGGLMSGIENIANEYDSKMAEQDYNNFGNKNPAAKLIEESAQGYSFIMSMNDLRKLSQANTVPGKFNNGINPVTMATDAIFAGGGTLTEMMVDDHMEDFQSDEFDLQAVRSYGQFRDFANSRNALRGSNSSNTVILVYTNFQVIDNFIQHASPTWFADVNKDAASSQYNMNAKYVYWGYLKDYQKTGGTLLIKGSFELK